MQDGCARARWIRGIGMFIAAVALPTAAQGEGGRRDRSATDDDQIDDEVIVTGTRLRGGDPTARVEVITAEEIAMQGLSTAEDIIRSLPQNFSTINSSNSLLFGSDLLDVNLGALGLGAVTANLRGFGSQNTLVLLNGKRLAGIQSSAQQLSANLNDIPAAAIDRIEISLDGGSAVYGSDAVAGVINIILKEDFRGLSVGGKAEHSNTGGHRRSASLFGGHGWDGGMALATVTASRSDPVVTAETGYVSNDYSGRYGGDQLYNFTGTSYPRSGTVALSRWGPATLILPPGSDGRNAQPADFVAPGPGDYLDVIPKDIGGSTDRRSLTLVLAQSLGARDQLELRTDILYSETETESEVTTFGFAAIEVPASNAFNNFGHDVFVTYHADTEVELGLVPHVRQKDLQKQLRYVLGVTYAFHDNLRLALDHTKSESSSEGDQYMFAPPSLRIDDPARYERLSSLISDSNPDIALNLFGDGTGQNPTIGEFYRSYANDDDRTHTRSTEPKLLWQPWEIAGGRVDLTLGAEFRKEWIETPGDDFNETYIGTGRPTVELTAYFVEVLAPLVGERNRRPFVEQLAFSLQSRYDDYSTSGSVENDADGNPIPLDVGYSNRVTRVGMLWRPSAAVFVRASRSEAFRTPTVSNLFGGTSRRFDTRVYDPLADPPFVPAVLSYGPSPDLRPESSTNWSADMAWTPRVIEGLEVKVAWALVDLEDRIASGSALSGLLPVEVYGNLPEFFVRDENGDLVESISRYVNISRRAREELDLELTYAFRTDFGHLRPRLVYHRVLDMFDEAKPGTGEHRFYGESIGVDEYALSANVTLTRDQVTAELWVRHTPSYTNNDHERAFRQLPNERVASRTTTDLTVAYEMDNGLLFRVGGRNIFNRDFPFMLSSSRRPYDSKRVDLRKRVLFFEMRYELGG